MTKQFKITAFVSLTVIVLSLLSILILYKPQKRSELTPEQIGNEVRPVLYNELEQGLITLERFDMLITLVAEGPIVTQRPASLENGGTVASAPPRRECGRQVANRREHCVKNKCGRGYLS